jgi:glyceraldehyde-3-phosphate dehydrogenase (NADP+)
MGKLTDKHTLGLSEQMAEMLQFRVLEQREYLSGGKLKVWNGTQQSIFSPVCNFVNGVEEPVYLGSVPQLDAAAALEILHDAEAAWDLGRGEWPVMRVRDRILTIEQFLKRFIEMREKVVVWMMLEIGKNRADAEFEFDRTSEYISDTIDAVKKLDRECSNLEHDNGILAQIRRGPLGVVLCMGPYNYPLNESFATLIPALIMGNTVVFKPARYGILLLSPLVRLFQETFPRGVVNFLYGDGKVVVKAIMETGKVDVLAFIGSSKTAIEIKKLHPRPNRLRSVLGLDAKNPAIILPDAQLESTVSECVNGALAFNGQRCTALKIIFVHESRVEEFLERFASKVDTLKAGLPWEKDAYITPLPESGKMEYLEALIADASEKGASIQNKRAAKLSNTLMFPAVLYPVNESMRIYHEEQFGPIVPVCSFTHTDEVLHYITNSNYGQQVSIFGQSPDQIAALIDPLVNQVCRVNINTKCQRGPDIFPFNGRKDSAEGTLSVGDALRVFSIRTMVATRETPENRALFSHILEERMSHFLSDHYLI